MTPELEKIYNTAFDLIELRLNKKEQVYPFTVHLVKGEGKPVISMHESESSETKEVIASLQEEMRTRATKGEIVALCIGYDMHITDPRTNEETDAILFELADRSGTKNIFVPYDFQSEEIIKKPFENSSENHYF